jgi:hypothetical protein
VRAEFFVNLLMVSLGEEMQIHFAHDRSVAVSIGGDLFRPVPTDNSDTVRKIPRSLGKHRLEKTFHMHSLRRRDGRRIDRIDDRDFPRVRTENSNRQVIAGGVRAEDAEWVRVSSDQERRKFDRIQRFNGK